MNTLETAQTHITRFTPQTGAPRAAVALRVSRQRHAPPAKRRRAGAVRTQISELLGSRTLPAVTVACRRAASNLRPSDYGRASTGIIDRRGSHHD